MNHEELTGYLGFKDLINFYITTIRGKRRLNNVVRRNGQRECNVMGNRSI